VCAQRLFDAQPGLLLAHALARIERKRAHAGGARVLRDLLQRESLRIVRLQVERVGGERELRSAIAAGEQAHLLGVATRAAVVAISTQVQVFGACTETVAHVAVFRPRPGP
jgi:hypothetical protein